MIDKLEEGLKLTDGNKTGKYYIKKILNGGKLLEIKKPYKCQIHRISDDKYMGEWNYVDVLEHLRDGGWTLL